MCDKLNNLILIHQDNKEHQINVLKSEIFRYEKINRYFKKALKREKKKHLKFTKKLDNIYEEELLP